MKHQYSPTCKERGADESTLHLDRQNKKRFLNVAKTLKMN